MLRRDGQDYNIFLMEYDSVPGFALRGSCYVLRVARYGVRDAGIGLRVARCEFRVARYEFWGLYFLKSTGFLKSEIRNPKSEIERIRNPKSQDPQPVTRNAQPFINRS